MSSPFLRKFVPIVFASLFLGLLLTVFFIHNSKAQSSCSDYNQVAPFSETQCCSGGLPCITKYYGGLGCSCDSFWCSVPGGCLQRYSCVTCTDNSQVCISYYTLFTDKGSSFCASGETCCCGTDYSGTCAGGGGGEENNFCSLASPSGTYKGVNHTCAGTGTGDFTVQMGDTFSLNYSYLGTGPSFPLEARTIMRGPQGVAPTETLDCVYTEDAAVGVWHSVTKAGFTCPATPGTYDYTIRCKASDNPSPAICGYFDDSLGCRVKCVVPPASLGYLKIYHQALGVIKLNLISADDALLKSPFPGMVKVARFNGDTNSAADLVPVSDPMASPVRVYTGLTGAGSPNGIWAWKKLP